MSDQVKLLRRGTVVRHNDIDYVVAGIQNGTVVLRDTTGRPALELPLIDAVKAAQRDDAPPHLPNELHHFEQRLTDKQAARALEARQIVHLLTTGRILGDHPDQPPIPELDPRLLDLSTRINNLADIRCEKLRTNGKRKGQRVKSRSERRNIERILKRSRQGEAATVDPRLTKPRRDRQPDALWEELYSFLLDRSPRSTVSVSSLIRDFVTERKRSSSTEDLPSERTLRKMITTLRDQNPEGLAGIAASRRSANNRPPASMRRRMTTRPGELVLFDTTKANVWVSDPRTGKAYRPEITIAMDHYTRAIVGMSISVLTSGIGVALCLADVLRPKSDDEVRDWSLPGDALYKQPYVGVPTTWGHIQAFVPEAAVSDNGKPFVSAFTSNQIARLGIDFEPQRSYTPTDKPQVERGFGTFKTMFEELWPAYTGGSVQDKGEDPEGEQRMSGPTLERRVRHCIDLYNNHPHQGLFLEDDPFRRLSPYMMWEISVERQGVLRTTRWSKDWIRFLPSDSAVIGAGGVRIKRLQYQNAPVLEALRLDRTISKSRNVQVFYNPADLRVCYCFDAQGEAHELKWKYWRKDLPRFGEITTSTVANSFEGRAFTDAEFFDRLTSMFAEFRNEDEEFRKVQATTVAEEGPLDWEAQRRRFNEDFLDIDISRLRNAAGYDQPAPAAVIDPPAQTPEPHAPELEDDAEDDETAPVVDLESKRAPRFYRPGQRWRNTN